MFGVLPCIRIYGFNRHMASHIFNGALPCAAASVGLAPVGGRQIKWAKAPWAIRKIRICQNRPYHCRRRREIDPVCRLPMTQRDDLEPIGGLGTAATKGGSVKSRRLGQICVGANSQRPQRAPQPCRTPTTSASDQAPGRRAASPLSADTTAAPASLRSTTAPDGHTRACEYASPLRA